MEGMGESRRERSGERGVNSSVIEMTVEEMASSHASLSASLYPLRCASAEFTGSSRIMQADELT